MGCTHRVREYYNIKKKIMSYYTILLLLTTIVFVFVPVIGGFGETNANIVTYEENDYTNIKYEFTQDSMVIIKTSMSHHSGNAANGSYFIKATNESLTSIWVPIFDNDTAGPWGTNNTDGDGIYWGCFQIGMNVTDNTSGPGNPPYLHLENGEAANISEIAGMFPGDTQREYTIIHANYSNEPSGGNASISGYVINEQNATGIENAVMKIYDNSTDELLTQVTTNAQGFFNFTNLTSGVYDIESYKISVYESVWHRSISVSTNDSIVPNVNFSINLSSPPSNQSSGNASISGYILYESNNSGIIGANVEINENSSQYQQLTQTDTQGYYSFHNLSSGQYVLNISKFNEIPPTWSQPITVSDNNTHLTDQNVTINVSSNGSSPPQNDSSLYFVRGVVKDNQGTPVDGVFLEMMKHGPGENCFENSTFETNATGRYQFNLSVLNAGPGNYELRAMKDGYLSYGNWSVEVLSPGILWINITLTPFFENYSYLMGKVSSSVSGNVINNTEIVLLDTDFNHMIEMEGDMEYTNNVTYNNQTGYFRIPIRYAGEFTLIAFANGYYATMSESTITVTSENTTYWNNLSLEPAEPDQQQVSVVFTDLDDVTITINRTIVAESPMIRFALDFMPDIGNSNQIVSASEVSSFLEMMERDGPTVNVSLDESQQNEGEGGPKFLSIPINFLLDSSCLDAYEPGTIEASLENIVNTSVRSNATLFFNATFNLTLDGTVLNQLLHNFTTSCEYAIIINNSITVDFGTFYNISSSNNNTNMSLMQNGNSVLIQPGNGDSDALAYAWVTLELNTSTISLPVIDTPTWHVSDQWRFNNTGEGYSSQVTYSVMGKPIKQWDIHQYRIGDETLSYICYELRKENYSMGYNEESIEYASLNNLDWVSLDFNFSIESVINDLDFPLFSGKTWTTTSWWGQEEITATVINPSTTKTTDEGSIDNCVYIEYTNASDAVVGKEWYAPQIKFFVNRTQISEGSIINSLDLSTHSFAPFIESIDSPYANDTNNDGSIDYIEVNITLNTSGLSQQADYIIEGPFYKEGENWEPPTEITWIEEELQDIDNTSHPVNVQIRYSGSLIRAREVNGPYTGFLELRELGEWGPEATIDGVEFQTSAYNYTAFTSPAVSITNITDYGNDSNNNGRYDYLTLNLTVNVSEAGNYSIHGGIEYVVSHGNWDEWWWITGTGTGRYELDANSSVTIPLNFDGRDIYDRGYNGRYRYHLEIVNDDTWQRLYEKEGRVQHSYNYSDFETPSMYFNHTYAAQTGQHDYINQGTFFTVNTSILVEEGSFQGGSGSYEIHGGIHYYNQTSQQWGDFITGNGEDITLYEGENIISFNFDLSQIYQRITEDEYNGSLIVGMGFCEHVDDWFGPDIDNCDYITSNMSLGALPEPPVTMTIYNDTIIDDGDTLRLKAYVNITTNEYANKTYDIHGGVHRIVQEGEDEFWEFLTGMGTNKYLSFGCNIVTLNFSGMDIASQGFDGPYAIWMGVDDFQNHMQICNDEYTTQNYTISNFATPSISIDASNISDAINGTEYLSITVPITVSESGSYHIGGGIHWIEQMDNWENWVFITGTGQEQILSVGETNVTLNFEQGMIKNELENSGYNGPLMVHFGIENWTTWQPIASQEYQTQSYSASDFSAGALSIIDHSCSINENGDLVLNISVNSSRNDTYQVHGGIHWIEDMGDWENWMFITGIYEESEEIQNGTNYKEYTFNGMEIFNSLHDGPFKISIGFENKTTYREVLWSDFETAAYSYTDFASAAPGARILKENMSAGSCDYMNGSYLTVNVSISKNTNGTDTYWLDGGLEYVDESQGIWEFITGKGQEITVSNGTTIIPINFNAGDIYSSGRDGPYRVWIGLRNQTTWMDIDNYEYTTQTYTSSDAPEPPVSFGNMNETDSFINGSLFTVNVTINVTDESYAGNYDLHGGVHYKPTGTDWWEHITGTGNWVELENGTNIIQLNYNAGEINRSLPDGYNNNLQVFMGINQMDSWDEIARNEYETRVYQKSDFPGPSITLEVTNAFVNGSYFTVNTSITVSAGNNGEYDIHGGVNWIDTAQGWDDWRFITGTGQPVNLNNGTNNVSLNFNGGDIYNELQTNDATAKLSIWIGLSSLQDWMELTHDEYDTPSIYSYTDFSPPQLTLTCMDDYNNNTDFLTVNVSINATGDMLNQEYDLHAGIHWKEGWEWRFITGTHRRINITENMTIPLNFAGGSIRSSEHDGPYEVWVGVSNADQWEDITHDEYDTQAYEYTSFAAPKIRILQNNLTDYANGTQYLTINVSVNATEAGEYFLEGCLHWRSGFHWQWITWSGEEITIPSAGNYTFPLNFDGKELQRAEEEGWSGEQLVAWIGLMNTTSWAEINRVEEYELGSYTASEFASSPVQFNGSLTDTGINASGGNKPYTSLQVTVPLNVSIEGNYEIVAGLFNATTNGLLVKSSTFINESQQNVTVNFTGTKIYKKRVNGSYEFRAKIVNASTNTEYDRMKQQISWYNYTDFEEAIPEATLGSSITHYRDSENDLIVNITVNVSQTGLQYEVYGELFNASSVYITYASTLHWLNTTGEHIIQISFNGSAINGSGLDGPYHLEYLRLSASVDGTWEIIQEETDAYATEELMHDRFGGE